MDRGLGRHGRGHLQVERGLGVGALDGGGDAIALGLGDVDRAVAEACPGSLQIAWIPAAAQIYDVDTGRSSSGVGRERRDAVGRLHLRGRVHLA